MGCIATHVAVLASAGSVATCHKCSRGKEEKEYKPEKSKNQKASDC